MNCILFKMGMSLVHYVAMIPIAIAEMLFSNVTTEFVAIGIDEWDTGGIRAGVTIDGVNQIIPGDQNGGQINTTVDRLGVTHGGQITVNRVHLGIFLIVISICSTLALDLNSSLILNSNGSYSQDYLAILSVNPIGQTRWEHMVKMKIMEYI